MKNVAKTTIWVATTCAILMATSSNMSAGDRGWSTAGKILTGVVAASVLANALDCDRYQPSPAPVYVTPAPVYYAAPAPVYVQAPQPTVAYAPQPATVTQYQSAAVQPQPVAVQYQPAPPQVYYVQQPVYVPAPVVIVYPRRVYVPIVPVIGINFGFYHRHHGW